MALHRIDAPRPRGRLFFILALLLLVIGARTIASYAIEYQWWKEMGQVDTWVAMLDHTSA